ncbi:MAG TPA: DUF5132 domain-containing protein [Armatimonadota bacterium]
MALEEVGERLEGKGWLGLLIGGVILAPAVPAVAKHLRPAAKKAVKGYFTATEKAREWFAETGEQWQDLVAEAKAEHEQGDNGAEMMTLEPEPAPKPAARRPRVKGRFIKAKEETPEELHTEPA